MTIEKTPQAKPTSVEKELKGKFRKGIKRLQQFVGMEAPSFVLVQEIFLLEEMAWILFPDVTSEVFTKRKLRKERKLLGICEKCGREKAIGLGLCRPCAVDIDVAITRKLKSLKQTKGELSEDS